MTNKDKILNAYNTEGFNESIGNIINFFIKEEFDIRNNFNMISISLTIDPRIKERRLTPKIKISSAIFDDIDKAIYHLVHILRNRLKEKDVINSIREGKGYSFNDLKTLEQLKIELDKSLKIEDYEKAEELKKLISNHISS